MSEKGEGRGRKEGREGGRERERQSGSRATGEVSPELRQGTSQPTFLLLRGPSADCGTDCGTGTGWRQGRGWLAAHCRVDHARSQLLQPR